MASPSPSPSYGVDGTCGRQHNNTLCIPQGERSCCSENGFCGSNETYCFTRYGCQSDCVDPPAFYLTPTSNPTASTATVTSTPSPTQTQSLTTGQITGIIIGAILFAVIAVVLLWLFFWHKSKAPITLTRTYPNGTVDTLALPQSTARQFPQIMQNGNPWLETGRRPTAGGLTWHTQTDGQYLGDPDDYRIENLD